MKNDIRNTIEDFSPQDIDNAIGHSIDCPLPNDGASDRIIEKVNAKTGLNIKKQKRAKFPIRTLVAVAAAFALFVAGIGGYGIYDANYVAASTVSLDVNPSIELIVNKGNKVISVSPKNEDAVKVLGDMDLTGSDINVAVNALIGSMLRNGYITEIANSILISVENKNSEKAAALQNELTALISTMLHTDSFEGAVLSQTVTNDDALGELAEKYGITKGKAQLISDISEQNPLYSFDKLCALSINDLNLIANGFTEPLSHVEATGSASEKAYIGKTAAFEIALNAAGITAADAFDTEIDLSYERGIMVYEVEFDTVDYEYDFDIDAITGEIVKTDREPADKRHSATVIPSQGTENTDTPVSTPANEPAVTTAPPASAETPAATYIASEAALGIALEHAGLTRSEVREIEIDFEKKKNGAVYEIDFEKGNVEYEYEINAITGEIIKVEKEKD